MQDAAADADTHNDDDLGGAVFQPDAAIFGSCLLLQTLAGFAGLCLMVSQGGGLGLFPSGSRGPGRRAPCTCSPHVRRLGDDQLPIDSAVIFGPVVNIVWGLALPQSSEGL